MKAPDPAAHTDALFAEAMRQAPWTERATWVNTRRHDLTRLVDSLGAEMHRAVVGMGELREIEATARQLQARVEHIATLCRVLDGAGLDREPE